MRCGIMHACGVDKSTIIAKLREHEAELRAAGVERLSLFGSHARGTAVQILSDVDLIAEFDVGREHSLLERARLENRLADMLGAKKDLALHGCRRAAFANAQHETPCLPLRDADRSPRDTADATG
ncbi:MAG: nucleotidyltransferase domain-containing protein [Bryobacteraceae bacterium]